MVFKPVLNNLIKSIKSSVSNQILDQNIKPIIFDFLCLVELTF